MNKASTPKKTIFIQCTAKKYVPLSQFRMMQHRLKERKRKHVERLAKLIDEHGFMFPIFAWEHVDGDSVYYTICDGHGRYNALKLLEKKGYTIPDIPVVIIEADNEIQAKKKLLEVGNLNGQIDFGEYQKFTVNLQLDLTDLFVPNVTEHQPESASTGFFPEIASLGMCTCPKCGKITPIK